MLLPAKKLTTHERLALRFADLLRLDARVDAGDRVAEVLARAIVQREMILLEIADAGMMLDARLT